MPPNAPSSPALITRPSTSVLNFCGSTKYRQLRKMEVAITRKRLIHLLVFVLACMSVFRLVRFAATSYSLSPRSTWTAFSKACNYSESSCRESSSPTSPYSLYPRSKPTSKKEFRFLSNIISKKAPCNLLIFGWDLQYRHLAKANLAGTTVFLEDYPERVRRLRKSNNTRIYKVNYNTKAKEAYKMLKYAREEPACRPNAGHVEKSACKLALLDLPDEVYSSKWDVILVDGPSGDGPEAPGRMTAIYTSSMIARQRAENSTANVVIHDVDRIIEKWYSREFLCEENLVSSKGRFWNFKIKGGEQSSRYTGIIPTAQEIEADLRLAEALGY
ncbi:arabinogalactan O-methyltransferase 2 [Silene latifolia]|uniref:arabinogalactan O-methyltransferase 2 n=1 Tax=Silene latifolia TaxID=37657 RepID=UPI003D777FB3